jgi:hypothetical protein
MGNGMMKDEMKMKHMGAMMGDMSHMMKSMSDKMGSGTMAKDDMMMQQEKMKKMKDQMSGM